MSTNTIEYIHGIVEMKVIKIFAEERQEKILQMLASNVSLKVCDLSNLFNVSETTIRRDLQTMEDKGLLSRTHGGAVRTSQVNYEASFLQKKDEMHDEKTAIGRAAAKIINDGDTIILDSGTTTLEIAKNITAVNLTVITNSIDIAEELSHKKDIDIIVTGGSLRTNTRAMVGHITENALKQFRVDKVFIGTNGISPEAGITTPNFIEAQTKRAMINSGSKIIVAADSSKFNVICISLVCEIKDVSCIITTSDAPGNIIAELENAGIQVLKSM